MSSMSPPPDADGITTRLRRLVSDEPPFAVPVSAALDNAVPTGQRRRLRTVLTRSAAALCVVVALATAIAGYPPSSGPGPGQAPDAGGGVVSERVTVGLYSGRVDPGWTLTADERAQLDLALTTLVKATGMPPQGGLGYHGFRITRSDGTELIAYQGAVAPAGTGHREYLAAPTRPVRTPAVAPRGGPTHPGRAPDRHRRSGLIPPAGRSLAAPSTRRGPAQRG